MKQCYVIILNYKRWDETVECIRSVFDSSYETIRVIVVDNDSGNQSLENIREALRGQPVDSRLSSPVEPVLLDHAAFAAMTPAGLGSLTLVQNNRNAGFAAGNNIAIRAVIGEEAYICLLNPDMTLERNALNRLVECVEERPKAIAGTVHRSFDDHDKIIQYGGARINYWSGNSSFIRRPEDISRIQYISGGCLFTNAATYRDLGLLPEEYFLYWEETDWCYHATNKGYTLVVCRQAISYDKRSTSIGNGFLADYFYVRNGLLFLKKYKRTYLPTAFAMVFVRIAKKLALGQGARAKGSWKGVIDFLTGSRYEDK